MKTMMEGLKAAGEVRITIHRADGRVEARDPILNLVGEQGSMEFTKLIQGEASSPPLYIAVGTATGAVAVADTTLAGEADRKIMSAYATSLNTLVQVCTFGGDADSLTGVDITEMGTFNHASSGEGELCGRIMHSSSTVTLAASDLVKYEYVTTVGTHS